MSKIIGIDLGTTNSGVAIVRDGQPQMLPHGGERIIPSVVSHTDQGKWLVGTPARNQYVLDPDNTVQSVKRKMGSKQRIKLAGREFAPQEISAFILRELKQIAEKNIGEPISEAVITVPAYFSDAQRQATRDAGRIAGLNVRRIINEPTAAALAYGLNLEEDKLVLVYDLGGGTFDVSLVELMGGIVEVQASHGDTSLGGDDFDHKLAKHIADWFDEENGVDVWADTRARARLLRAAEQAKIELSSRPFSWVKEAYLLDKDGIPLHLEYEISRALFEEEIEPLLARTVESIEQVLREADVSRGEIDQVLLVGGSSRIPAVHELVAEAIGLEPQIAIDPDEAVTLGAAVQAAVIAGEPIDAILVDITPHSLGTSVANFRLGQLVTDRYKVLIHRNSTIPTSKEEVFNTLHPSQDTIKVEVYQGEQAIASQNSLLGDFLMEDLQAPHLGELAQVTVRFDLDVDGILHVTAQDRFTKQTVDITVEASLERLAEGELLEAQKHLAKTAVSPLSETAKAMIQRGKKLLAEDALSDSERTHLIALLDDIERAQTESNNARVDELLETLLDLLFDYE
ncbi:Chaperone protein DnaK [hydrothermal vent metagenome]|uniref:Chaperone protein DnaK n=1 Tax=hydrothermal vent metagenome TaxID=652676 RepID=A0A3B0V5I4_9ZZZZ